MNDRRNCIDSKKLLLLAIPCCILFSSQNACVTLGQAHPRNACISLVYYYTKCSRNCIFSVSNPLYVLLRSACFTCFMTRDHSPSAISHVKHDLPALIGILKHMPWVTLSYCLQKWMLHERLAWVCFILSV